MIKINLDGGDVRVDIYRDGAKKFCTLSDYAGCATPLDDFVRGMSEEARAAIRSALDEEPASLQASLFD